MAIQEVIIFEFAPTADEIWCVSRHDRDGYVSYDAESGLASILDTAHNAKPRPKILATYAGGKATNVTRVLDRLLANDKSSKFHVKAKLITFLPPPPEGLLQKLDFKDVFKNVSRDIQDISLVPSTAAGIYVQCLQLAELKKVKPHFETLPDLEESGEMQTTRRCIEMILEGGSGSLNFSPRIMWSQKAAKAVILKMREVAEAAILRLSKVKDGALFAVLAGSPPRIEPGEYTSDNFYAKVIEDLKSGKSDCQVSIDTPGQYLHECLITQKMPDFVFMNTDELRGLSWKKSGEGSFSGTTLLAHDKDGCWVWHKELPNGLNAKHYPSIRVPRVYSTIGAGDAMHAGFLKEWICAESEELSSKPYALCSMPPEERLHRAVVYSQVVAAAAVSNEKATHGIDAQMVESKFRQVWQETEPVSI